MKSSLKILFKSLVKPFYKENAGAFAFVFVVMFCIIGKVDGAGVFEYHYSLIIGMLKNLSFLLLVFFASLLYARKYTAYASGVIRKPETEFLFAINCLSKTKHYILFLLVELALLMPVVQYSFFYYWYRS